MTLLRRLFLHSWKRYLAAALTALAMAGLCLLTQGHTLRIHYVNAVTVAGAVVFLLGMLQLVSFFGAFDSFGYAFSSIGNKRRYHDLYEYVTARKEARSHRELTFMPFITVGLLVLAAGILLGGGLW